MSRRGLQPESEVRPVPNRARAVGLDIGPKVWDQRKVWVARRKEGDVRPFVRDDDGATILELFCLETC